MERLGAGPGFFLNSTGGLLIYKLASSRFNMIVHAMCVWHKLIFNCLLCILTNLSIGALLRKLTLGYLFATFASPNDLVHSLGCSYIASKPWKSNGPMVKLCQASRNVISPLFVRKQQKSFKQHLTNGPRNDRQTRPPHRYLNLWTSDAQARFNSFQY